MTDRSRGAVGIYERPHRLRTRRVLMPIGVVAVVVAIGYALWFLLR